MNVCPRCQLGFASTVIELKQPAPPVFHPSCKHPVWKPTADKYGCTAFCSDMSDSQIRRFKLEWYTKRRVLTENAENLKREIMQKDDR